jgi:hypothetical protein
MIGFRMSYIYFPNVLRDIGRIDEVRKPELEEFLAGIAMFVECCLIYAENFRGANVKDPEGIGVGLEDQAILFGKRTSRAFVEHHQNHPKSGAELRDIPDFRIDRYAGPEMVCQSRSRKDHAPSDQANDHGNQPNSIVLIAIKPPVDSDPDICVRKSAVSALS